MHARSVLVLTLPVAFVLLFLLDRSSKMGFGGMVDSMALLTAISAIDLNGFFEVTSDLPQLIAQLTCFAFEYLLLCKYANLRNRAAQSAPYSWS